MSSDFAFIGAGMTTVPLLGSLRVARMTVLSGVLVVVCLSLDPLSLDLVMRVDNRVSSRLEAWSSLCRLRSSLGNSKRSLLARLCSSNSGSGSSESSTTDEGGEDGLSELHDER
jgi:hypothetical protein